MINVNEYWELKKASEEAHKEYLEYKGVLSRIKEEIQETINKPPSELSSHIKGLEAKLSQIEKKLKIKLERYKKKWKKFL